jgi:hypothetical protein
MIVYQLFQNIIRVLSARCSLPFGAWRLRGSNRFMSLNFLHSRFPHWEAHIESLDSQVPPSDSRQIDVCQILLTGKNKIKKKRLLLVRVAKLTVFQHSKVLDVDDDIYSIS